MGFRKLAILFVLLFLSCSFVFAQTLPSETPQPTDPAADAENAKKKKELDERIVQMLEQAVGSANSLRLSQNRAIVYAMSGDLYWKFDEKRARILFRDSAAEIINFNAETEKEQRATAGRNFGPPEQNDIRSQILPLVARHDAELAYQMLLQTRPAKIAEAMAKAPQPATRGGGGGLGGGRANFDPTNQQVAQEVALEQQLALLAAANDPDAAIKLIKDSLSKGISANVLPLLQNLYKKEEKKAGDLAGDVVRNVVDADLTKNNQDMNVALSFLQFATQANTGANSTDKQFHFSDSQVKDLANKLVNTFLGAAASAQLASMMNRAIPILQKVVPERIAALNQKLAESQKGNTAGGRGLQQQQQQQQQQRQFDRNATPEEILAQIPKMTTEAEKRVAYQSLAGKIGQITDDSRAQKLIDQIADDTARAAAQQRFDSAKVGRTAASGKLEDARAQIGTLTDKKTQIQKMVSLAMQFQKSGGEKNLESALSLMKDAKGLTNESPEDEDELADLMEVVRGYTVIEPETAFRLVEPLIDEFNNIVQATAVLSKYNKRDPTFKKGELVMKMNANFGGGGLLMFRYIPQLQMLGKADLDRMSLISDRFGRNDARTIVKLFVIQGFLKEDAKPIATGVPPTGGARRN